MVYEIEYFEDQDDLWNVPLGSQFVEKKVDFARIVSDTIDEVGLAIDEINEKWPGGPVDGDLSNIMGTCGGLELLPDPNGGKIAQQLPTGFLPTRVRGKWQVFWGRILW